MENSLPEGWQIKNLVEHVPIVKTGVREYKGEKPYYSTGAVVNDNISPEGHYSFKKKPSRANRLVLKGDVVQARMQGTTKALLIDEKIDGSLFSTGFLQFRPSEHSYNSKLFYHYLCSDLFLKQRDELASGSTQIALTDKGASHINLVIPPSEQQKRIADKLDSLLAKVKDAQSRLDTIPVILNRFRQSVLLNACSGELTKTWRKANKENDEWDIKKLADLGEVTGGITKNAKRKTLKIQVPYLRVANVYENRLELGQVLKIGVTEREFERTVLREGDLLFVEGNGSLEQIGRVALWDGSIKKCVHQNHLIKFRAGNRVDPSYVLLQMMAPSGRAQLIEKAVSTAGLHSLSISKISEADCPVPSMAEQKEIIRRVKTLFTFVEQVNSRYRGGKEHANKLEQSILAKAFRGELVR